MIMLGAHNPGHDIVGSQLKIYIRPVETFPQPSREWPWQPCRDKEAKLEWYNSTIKKKKQNKPKRMNSGQAKSQYRSDKRKDHTPCTNSQNPFQSMNTVIPHWLQESSSIILNALSGKRKKSSRNKHLSQCYLPTERKAACNLT